MSTFDLSKLSQHFPNFKMSNGPVRVEVIVDLGIDEGPEHIKESAPEFMSEWLELKPGHREIAVRCLFPGKTPADPQTPCSMIFSEAQAALLYQQLGLFLTETVKRAIEESKE